MALYRDRVLPHLVDRFCNSHQLRALRREVAADLSGTVIEIGFGSGLNLAAYPAAVTRVYAVEPSPGARQLATERIREYAVPVEYVGLTGESIDLDDDTCDAALCTFTLCTIPDVTGALAELRRVLRPGAVFRFLEHGLAPEPSVATWQRRLEPVQKLLAGGCHLTRDATALVRDAGFVVEHTEARYTTGPRIQTWTTSGFAHNPA